MWLSRSGDVSAGDAYRIGIVPLHSDGSLDWSWPKLPFPSTWGWCNESSSIPGFEILWDVIKSSLLAIIHAVCTVNKSNIIIVLPSAEEESFRCSSDKPIMTDTQDITRERTRFVFYSSLLSEHIIINHHQSHIKKIEKAVWIEQSWRKSATEW